MDFKKISFSTTCVYDHPKSCSQHLGNMIENSLYFGGRRVHVHSENKQQTIIKQESIPLWKTILKISLFVVSLGLIPLVLLIAKAIYRSSHKFYVVHNSKKETHEEKLNPKQMGQRLIRNSAFRNGEKIKYKFHGEKFILSETNEHSLQIQKVEKTLGRGGFGKVTQLVDIETGVRTALKVATPSKLKNTDYSEEYLNYAKRALEREWETIEELNKGGNQVGIQKRALTQVVQVRKIYPSRSKERVAFECDLYQGTLDKVKVYDLSIDNQLSIILEIVKGVQYFRKLGFVHCDLKSQNIFYNRIQGAYHVYIADFGGAWKEGQCKDLAYTPGYAQQTDIHEIVESFTSKGQFYSGKKHDIYSLGKVIEETLFGRIKSMKKLRREKFINGLIESGYSNKKIDEFVSIIDRMLIEETHNPIADKLKLSGTRPSIGDVVNALNTLIASQRKS